jgi:hypothetical protein
VLRRAPASYPNAVVWPSGRMMAVGCRSGLKKYPVPPVPATSGSRSSACPGGSGSSRSRRRHSRKTRCASAIGQQRRPACRVLGRSLTGASLAWSWSIVSTAWVPALLSNNRSLGQVSDVPQCSSFFRGQSAALADCRDQPMPRPVEDRQRAPEIIDRWDRSRQSRPRNPSTLP